MMEKAGEKPLSRYSGKISFTFRPRGFITATIGAIFQVFFLYFLYINFNTRRSTIPNIAEIQKCSIDNLKANLSFLDPAKPITSREFLARRERLAQALVASSVDAFVLEPGYTFQYYANISQHDWEPWEPEERPFLMIVQPDVDASTGAVKAKTSFLSPHFEEGRVRMLGIPAEEDERLDIVVWEEHWNPYETLRASRTFKDRNRKRIMVDEEIRDYIVRGLTAAGFESVGLGGEVAAVRQIKSRPEIELLRAVNTGTVEAVRAMRPCLVPGLTENEVVAILDGTMLSIGFEPFFDIVLFEENGALPHGGFATGDKVLTEETMVLIDVGAHYMGYSSDICRSFFIHPSPPGSRNRGPEKALLPPFPPSLSTPPSDLHALKLKIFSLVFAAQTASTTYLTATNNHTAADVDVAARSVIASAGYGKYFTHRVGHGIGIKAHESPYLNKGNNATLLRAGMVFTSEPGVYLEGRFGVRLEDVFLVGEDEDHVECLSGRRAGGPYDP